MTDSQSIIPVLVCADIEGEHDFLVSAFGFEPGGVSRDGDGIPVHGEVRVNGAAIWLHRVTEERGLVAAGSLPGQTGGLVVNVENVDAHYTRARAAGAVVDGPPTDQPYGRREYGARDPEGHRWWLGTPLDSDSAVPAAQRPAS